MKKIHLIGFLGLSLLVLGACGDSGNVSKEKIETSVESVFKESSEKASTSSEEGEKKEKVEYNQNVVDDENVKISLISIEHIIDKTFDEERYEVLFDVTNKREKTLTVQAREVSINDRMVDESLLTMSTDVSAGKTAGAKMVIQSYSGDELPEMTGNLELILHSFNTDYEADDDFAHDVPVKVTLK